MGGRMDGWKGKRGGPGEQNHYPQANFREGEMDATGHLRKRSFTQAFVPANHQDRGQMTSFSQNRGGLLPTPRLPRNGTGEIGMQDRSGNVNGMGRSYAGNMGYNDQMGFYHLDPAQNQYINRMLPSATPPPRVNGGSMNFQGIHGAVPLVRMPPTAVSSMGYDYTNAPVAVIPPWRKQQQQEQYQGIFGGANCDSNKNERPLHGHNQRSSLVSINNNGAYTGIHIVQEGNASVNNANAFANSVVSHSPFHPNSHPMSQELPPPVVPLEIPPPTSYSSSLLPLPSSRPYVGFAMSTPSDNQNSTEEQSSSKKLESVKPKRLEVKKSTPTASTASAILIGKRPGGRQLPTGVIKRPDPGPSAGNDAKNGTGSPKSPFSRYMAQVELYRNRSCSDETPNRPLVK